VVEVWPQLQPELVQVLIKQSQQSQSDFNTMTSILEDTYTFPQTVGEQIEMEEKYNEKIAFRDASLEIMYNYFTGDGYIPQDVLKIIIEYI
jgi:hypothetical protein